MTSTHSHTVRPVSPPVRVYRVRTVNGISLETLSRTRAERIAAERFGKVLAIPVTR